MTPRKCLQCGVRLPAKARRTRVYCSSRCRQLRWESANRPAEETAVLIRLHWHAIGPQHWLYRDRRAGYWRGEGCPPECDRVPLPPDWSTGIPEGREGLAPVRPDPRDIARRADGGGNPLPLDAPGSLPGDDA
jgi:hypothetical protein